MKTTLIIILAIFSLSSQASLRLNSLKITQERLKLLQENSELNINYQKIEDHMDGTPVHHIKGREGNPAYVSPNTQTPSLTIDRTDTLDQF